MKINDFKRLLERKVLVLDGATGTELQNAGLPHGACPELWVLKNPDKLIGIQKEYLEAGSDAVYTCTFGANRIKLKEFDKTFKVEAMNARLAEISRKTVGDKALVIGCIGPTGAFIEPFGEVPFEEAVKIFREQASGLVKGGADLFVIETMMDVQETRAALIAIKEVCDLPVIVSMTFTEQGQTLTGTPPETALVTLQSLGASAFGCNCSVGPQAMLSLVMAMKPFSTIPIHAKPNAGLPKLVNGKTVFDMGADEFASFGAQFINAGVNIIGGCCGTKPEYIKKLKAAVKSLKPEKPRVSSIGAVSSTRKTVFISNNQPLKIIGERINPTGKKTLQEELKAGKFKEVRRFAVEQKQNGADVLDVNMGMPGIDEKETLFSAVRILSHVSDLPLCVDSSKPEAVEAALRIYPGRALINSISGEKEKLRKFLPIAAKYGAMFILLPLGDNDIPDKAEGRAKFVEKVMSQARKYGFTKEDVIVDGLVMTVSANQEAAKETLKVVEWSSRNGFSTVLGLSNVSFGLPERKWVNSAFLSMAISRGLTFAIANPDSMEMMSAKFASDVLMGRDKGCRSFISRFQNSAGSANLAKTQPLAVSITEHIYKSVLNGDKDHVYGYVEKALKEKIDARKIVDECLIPAINKVGELFDRREYFLPQLIMSAEAMKAAFDFLEPHLRQTGKSDKTAVKRKIILATVKGDIHDIGKNIVALMLKNYGYEVIDLGKDVGPDAVIEAAKSSNAEIIGLSALMTTTMTQMKVIIDQSRKSGLKKVKYIIGGAVVTQDYADEIGADGYATDSVGAVRLVQKLLK
ncbi:MAG TPA: 5-methyltetrahydrofolate--homocysteine methyltransferase [Lentisphaeria bacterium]|nr:MAG: 5-methyltetrahydrofolate--homocysteine methyltransferase [Lentisphaerae bacterium GWF2_50_93]HCE44797.1 5-methyltetrahydrofolate--homocysteine methyltransferase [Lentisphaeria bacterium]